MKKLFLLFLCIPFLLAASPLQQKHIQVIGVAGVVMGGECTSGTTDTYYDGEHGDWGADALVEGDVYGQSFTVSKAGKIYSIEVDIYNFSSGENVTLRVGDATTLGDTHTATVTVSGTGSVGLIEFVLNTPMDVESSTTYYFGLKGADNAGDSRIVKRRNLTGSDGYANGTYRYGGTWALGYSETTSDARFKVNLCD